MQKALIGNLPPVEEILTPSRVSIGACVTIKEIKEEDRFKTRVPIVEDNPANQKVAQIHLKKLGHASNIPSFMELFYTMRII